MSNYTAVAYYSGIPSKNNNSEKPKILDNFILGVNASGDRGIAHRAMNVIPCDVALIQGFVHPDGKDLPHLRLRKAAIDMQKKNGRRSLIVDSNLFLYKDQNNSKTYLRYSFDGVFPTTGFYFDTDVDPQRWQKISRDLNISLKPWRSNGNHVLICLQRNGGWSMGGLSSIDWLFNTIKLIKTNTDRPIIVRTHPGDKKIKQILRVKEKNVSMSVKEKLTEDLQNAWCSVVYNSSPGVASSIEGIPTFVTDPDPKQSQSFDVANFDLKNLENPMLLDRQQWIEKLSMCHWNFDELKSGEAWQFFRKYI